MKNPTAVLLAVCAVAATFTIAHSAGQPAKGKLSVPRCATPEPTAAEKKALHNLFKVEDAKSAAEMAKYQPATTASKNSKTADGAQAMAIVRPFPGPLTINIRVYFHVITDSKGKGNVTDTQIRQQIDVMNRDYSGKKTLPNGTQPLGPAANLPFRFVLAGVDRTASDTYFNSAATDKYLEQPRPRLHRGDARSLNIYTGNLLPAGLLGIAHFPWYYAQTATNPYYPTDAVHDGIAVDYGSLPGGADAPDNLGDTASHEAGHWLGLLHTFSSGRFGDGCDTYQYTHEIADIPAERSPFYGAWPPIRDSCSSYPGLDPVENFMDYTDDAYYYRFTTGQEVRAYTAWRVYRQNGGFPVNGSTGFNIEP